MKCIPANQTLIMKLTQDNKKKVHSPPINDTFSINSDGVYNFIISSLNNKNYNESYNFLNQLKTIIRCVWKTMFTVSKYPDLKYISFVSNYPITNNPIYGERVLKITPKTKELDSETLAIIQRNLIPVYDYDIKTMSNDLWDKYLLIFDNILLSENIQHRKILKLKRDEQLKQLSENRDETYDQQHQKIMKTYTDEIETLKHDYIFKIVNYLNWLHYNNVNTDMAWAVVLLRLYVITKNKYHNEQYQHDEKDFADYIRNYKYTNDRELLELYIAIIVYRYQFVDCSIIDYDKNYIEQMVYYLTGNLKPLNDYIDELKSNLIDNLQILRLLMPTDKLMEYILSNCLDKFTYKTKELYNKLLKLFPMKTLEDYGIKQRVEYLLNSSDICKMFNKLTNNNYKEITDKLNKHNKDNILECFKSSCLIEYGPYTKYVVKYMLSIFDKEYLNKEIINIFNNQQKYNKTVNILYGLLMSVFDTIDYYKLSKDKITTLLEAAKNNPTEKMKEFILSEANERMKTAKGYDKFQLETIADDLM